VDWPTGIGPVIDQVLRDDPDRWTPTGGDVLAQGTMELLVPLTALGMADWEGYSTEVFWDVGNVWMADPGRSPRRRPGTRCRPCATGWAWASSR
jgi:outer membrane protein assembly factor BamA